MKASEFKQLIKEAVKEAIKEEFLEITQQPMQEQVRYQDDPVPPVSKSKPVAPVKTGNAILDMLNETRASMTSEDYRNVIGANSSMAQSFPTGGARTATSVQAGLDLSQLSFVKNAGKILKVSNEKDKLRNGL